MTKLMFVFIFSCVFAWFCHVFSKYNNITNTYEYRNKLFFVFLIVITTVFAGLRVRYNDTTTYIQSYQYLALSKGSVFEDINFLKIGGNPGFVLLNNILKHLGFSPQLFIMFFAIITIPTYFWFIYKYTSDIAFSVLLFFALGIYTFNLAAIKQCLAVAFGLYAIDKLLKNKKFLFVISILIGCTIHPYVLLFLLAPFLTFKPWTKKTYWQLGIFLALGVLLQTLMGRVLDVTSMLGKEYTVSEMSGTGVNIFRFGVSTVPLIASFLLRNDIKEDFFDKQNNLMLNLSILNSLFMFVALFGTANYFGRLANYFLIFQVISIPWLLRYIDIRNRAILKLTAAILYLIYFIYANAMLVKGYRFDDLFDRISLNEFIEQELKK